MGVETFGLEVEVAGATTDSIRMLRRLCRGVPFNFVEDGSIRRRVFSADGLDLSVMPKMRRNVRISAITSERTAALEIVTGVLDYDQAHEFAHAIKLVYGHLSSNQVDPRASIHIHVGFRNRPWVDVRNVMRLWCHLEPALYRISGLGHRHRGVCKYQGQMQDYNYCRPLTAPIHAYLDDKRVPLINVDTLLHARTATQFTRAWGGMNGSWGNLPHYSPHRLHGINLVPLSTLGTLEWRVFNGVYSKINKALEVVKSFHDIADLDDPYTMIAEGDRVHNLGTERWDERDEVEDLLGVDLYSVWGEKPLPPLDSIVSHYSRNSIAFPTQRVENNRGVLDSGEASFSLYEG